MRIRKAAASRGVAAFFPLAVLACLGAEGSPEAGETEHRRNDPKAAADALREQARRSGTTDCRQFPIVAVSVPVGNPKRKDATRAEKNMVAEIFIARAAAFMPRGNIEQETATRTRDMPAPTVVAFMDSSRRMS